MTKLRFGDLTLEGRSRAGDRTWFRVQPPGLAFDVGRGVPALAGVGEVFLSHGHLDHALGVPYLLSERALQRLGPCRVHCPAAMAPALAALVEAGERLEETRYEVEIHGLEPGARVAVAPRWTVEAFATAHGVPSLGYHLIERRSRLAPHLAGASAAEIVARKRHGEAVEVDSELLRLSYCGDTGASVFEREPRLFDSRVLVVECTFLGASGRQRARRFGHLHIEDLAAQRERFANEALVLHHLSRKHEPEELRREVERLLPELAARVHVVT